MLAQATLLSTCRPALLATLKLVGTTVSLARLHGWLVQIGWYYRAGPLILRELEPFDDLLQGWVRSTEPPTLPLPDDDCVGSDRAETCTAHLQAENNRKFGAPDYSTGDMLSDGIERTKVSPRLLLPATVSSVGQNEHPLPRLAFL